MTTKGKSENIKLTMPVNESRDHIQDKQELVIL
jgi:hypothetical protein